MLLVTLQIQNRNRTETFQLEFPDITKYTREELEGEFANMLIDAGQADEPVGDD